MAKKETYAIVFDSDTVAALDACAERKGLSRSALIRMFCLEGIERMKIQPDFENMSNGELMAALDDEMQSLAGASHTEWATHPEKVKLAALKKAISGRMK